MVDVAVFDVAGIRFFAGAEVTTIIAINQLPLPLARPIRLQTAQLCQSVSYRWPSLLSNSILLIIKKLTINTIWLDRDRMTMTRGLNLVSTAASAMRTSLLLQGPSKFVLPTIP